MKAVVSDKEKQWVKIVDKRAPRPGRGEVVIRLHATALNHRDLNIMPRAAAEHVAAFTFGSDGSGVVFEVGEGVTDWSPGDEVVLDAAVWCGHCAACTRGEHAHCESFAMLGGAVWDGTFAEYIRVPARNLITKPAHLTHDDAAALPLALGTAWRSVVTKLDLKYGETVFIHGIGGGVALYALQISAAIGAIPIVSSGSNDKLDRATKLGAVHGVNYREEDVAARVLELTQGRGVDAVVDGVGQLGLSMTLARPGARIVNYGIPNYYEPMTEIDGAVLHTKQISLLGSSSNTHAELVDAIAFVNQSKLRPVIHQVYDLEQVGEAFEAMKDGRQFGKLVLRIA